MWWLAWCLACTTRPVPPEAETEPSASDHARVALHRAELALLEAQAEAHLAAGRLDEAAIALVTAERLGGLPALVDRVVAAAEAGDPVLAAQIHTSLADAVRVDPARARRHHDAASAHEVNAALLGRYVGEARAETLARQRGVGPELLGPVLDLAVAQHVEAPPPRVVAEAGAVRLGALLDVAGLPDDRAVRDALVAARAAPPGEWPAVVASGRALVAAASAAGLPVESATAEWVEGALSAFDPWTRVAWPAELEGWEVHHTGVELGVGLELEAVGDRLIVALPIPEAPAWRSGVHQGDVVVAVLDARGRTGADAGRDAIVAALRGEPGSELTLELTRDGTPRSFVMQRAPVPERTVHGWTVDDHNAPVLEIPGKSGVGYLRIAAFRPNTDDLAAELLGATTLAGLVLDLRGNAGGDVQAAANLVDRFVGEGIVARLVGPGAPPPPAEGEVAWNALLPGDDWEALPLAVLIDRDTASAAELAAGALAQREGVVLIGERTWGKGWSQGLVTDEARGFALQVTNAAWTTADGRPIHRAPGATSWGVDPDVALPESAAESWQNRARRAALEFPRAHADGSPMTPPEKVVRAELPLLPEDPAVARALAELTVIR